MEDLREDSQVIREWARDVFLFVNDVFGLKPAVPKDDLFGAKFERSDQFGRKTEVVFFDLEGELVYEDLSFYKKYMFKNQDRDTFERGRRLTWQQTVILEAYRRGGLTFNQDSYSEAVRGVNPRRPGIRFHQPERDPQRMKPPSRGAPPGRLCRTASARPLEGVARSAAGVFKEERRAAAAPGCAPGFRWASA